MVLMLAEPKYMQHINTIQFTRISPLSTNANTILIMSYE